MKKNKHNVSMKKKSVKAVEEREPETENSANELDSLDDEDQGFGGWLRSTDGLDTMKLFVVANSIIMVTTLAYPHIYNIFEIVSDMIFGPDKFY